jgi:hypothetical protein
LASCRRAPRSGCPQLQDDGTKTREFQAAPIEYRMTQAV